MQNRQSRQNRIVIGLDQSYKDTGISVSYNGKLKAATHCYTEHFKTNTEKRKELRHKLISVFDNVNSFSLKYNSPVTVIIERIRLYSQGFINIDYIKSIGALNALIVDTASQYNFPVYSVETKAWKAAVVGTSKPLNNPHGIDPKKWPTILWCVNRGYGSYIVDTNVGRKKKGVIDNGFMAYTYNDNISDSICISLYGFTPNPLLKEEK